MADAFPTTQRTWLGRNLDQGPEGVQEVVRHVMELYAGPLQIYFKGIAKNGHHGEARDIVHGFFADRLVRPDFLLAWRRSGLPLRRWLMNAFCFYLQECRRRQRRSRNEVCDDVLLEIADPSPPANQVIDRSYAISLVRLALEKTRQECRASGLGSHWDVFTRHHLDEEAYANIAPGLGISPSRASIMARTVRRRFSRAMHRILEREGFGTKDVDRELQNLLEVISS